MFFVARAPSPYLGFNAQKSFFDDEFQSHLPAYTGWKPVPRSIFCRIHSLLSGAPAAVDDEGTAGDERSFVAREIKRGGGNFRRFTHTAKGLGGFHLFVRLQRVGVFGDPRLYPRRLDTSGADAIHPHLRQGMIQRHTFGHSDNREFGGGVSESVAHGNDAGDRCEIDDRPALHRDHRRQKCLAHEHRSAHVDGVQAVKIRRGGCQDRADAAHPGVVDQHVATAVVFRMDDVDAPLAGIFISYIDGDELRELPFPADHPGGGLARLSIALGNVDLRAGIGEGVGNRQSDAGAGPGHHRHFPCQIEHAGFLSLVQSQAGRIMIDPMPQDHLEIGLEHHRNGRLTQAEASYRALLKIDSGNADAMHWLGVLHSQAGMWDEAVRWLEQAVAIRPGEAAFLHNLGQAALSGGRLSQAVAAFEAAAVFDRERAELRYHLAIALLARGAPDDAEEAVIALRQAGTLGMDSADLHRQLGAALLAANLHDEAIASLRTALEKSPDDVPARYLLAVVYQRLGKTTEVRKNLLKALEIEPTFVRGWCALAHLETDAGNRAQAIALYRRALSIKPDDAPALNALGQVLLSAGKQEESMAAMREAVRASRLNNTPPAGTVADLERKITLDSTGAELHYTLATITHLTPPARIPAVLLTDLYERYAGGFDEHLREKLHYRMPEMITDAIAAAQPVRPMDILDLGCGTGLCAPLLRPWASVLCGVDISSAMIEQAKARNLYDRLEVADLVTAMQRAERSFDLLVASDVLIYLGDLSGVFEAAARCLRPGGLWAYSVEAGGGERYHLQGKSFRFAHAKPYLQKLGSMYGFRQESFDLVSARTEALLPVASYMVVLRLIAA